MLTEEQVIDIESGEDYSDPFRDNADYHCDTLDKAMSAAAQLRFIRQQQQEEVTTVQARIMRLEHELRLRAEAYDKQAAWCENQLAEYLHLEYAKNPKLKTMHLPDATLHYRQQSTGFVRDDAILLAWAKKSNLPFVKVTEALQWGELKGNLKALPSGEVTYKDTGEVVPSVKAVAGELKFSIDIVE
jgi:hypothetical protein